MKKVSLIIAVIITVCLDLTAGPRVRPAEWASPVIESNLSNFYKVSDKVYRSEQPDSKAFKELAVLGITTVLNLRNYHTDNDEGKNTKIKLYHIKMNAGSITPGQIFQAMKIIKDSSGPVLVHCWHGSDRTGAVIAAYRMVFQNWTRTQAIDELKNGGYGYHIRTYPNILQLLNDLDVKAIKKRLNIK